MSKIDRLITTYRDHLTVPWQVGLAAIQRVIFAVYDKEDELRLRANIGEFELVTLQSNYRWLLIDITNSFPDWISEQEYREAYFECPEDLAGYQSGEVIEYVKDLILKLKEQISVEADANTVVVLLGVGSLFGLARVSTLVEGIKDSVPGRVLVFFPGEYQPDNHAYRLLDARDGWNYLAVPLIAKE